MLTIGKCLPMVDTKFTVQVASGAKCLPMVVTKFTVEVAYNSSGSHTLPNNPNDLFNSA